MSAAKPLVTALDFSKFWEVFAAARAAQPVFKRIRLNSKFFMLYYGPSALVLNCASSRASRRASVSFDMRKIIKFFHLMASAGLIVGLAAQMIILIKLPESEATSEVRGIIGALADYLLLPSLASVVVTGLLSMAVHTPFQEMRWAWLKALLGLCLFEAVLGVVAMSDDAAKASSGAAHGAAESVFLTATIKGEWPALWAALLIALISAALGVWRPSLKIF